MRETPPSSQPSQDPADQAVSSEIVELIHEEVTRLPERLRLPVILCGIEGHSREDVAQQLGWTLNAVKGGLERGRAVLAERLKQHGLAIPAVALTTVLEQQTTVQVPIALASGTVNAMMAVSSGQAIAGGAVTSNALQLSQGVILVMIDAKLKFAIFALCLAALMIGGSTIAWRQRAAMATKSSATITLETKPRESNPFPTEGEHALIKTPHFKTKEPLYGRLALGSEGQTKIWVILDGQSLYVDRNGNGDLTEADELLDTPVINANMDWKMISKGYHFADSKHSALEQSERSSRDVPLLKSTSKYRRFGLDFFEGKKNVTASKAEELKELQNWKEHFEGYVTVTLTTDGQVTQAGNARFAPLASDAPIVRFDGPLQFQLFQPALTFTTGTSTRLAIQIATRGIGGNALTRIVTSSLPKQLNPIAEIEYPTGESGSAIKAKITLDSRAGEVFYNVVEIPAEAESGVAKVTVSLSGDDVLDVPQMTFEVPVTAPK